MDLRGAVPQDLASTTRLPLLDLLRCLASQAIVFHHLAFYGPMSDVLYPLAAGLIDALYSYGRMAVQVFFVLGGFVMARSLEGRTGLDAASTLRLIGRRYRRIGGPYFAALGVVLVTNALASGVLPEATGLVGAPPTPGQLLAHAAFLQNILGYESLSAGVWYLAIDFQLGLLTCAVVALGQSMGNAAGRARPRAGVLTAQTVFWPLGVTSLFAINRDPRLDAWAAYHACYYVPGLLAAWCLAGRLPDWTFWLFAALMAMVGLVDDRPRLLVAAAVGAGLLLAGRSGVLATWPRARWVTLGGKLSYSLFLVHYPVQQLVSTAVVHLHPTDPGIALAGLGASWLFSLAAAVVLYRLVEEQGAAIGAIRGVALR